MNNLNKNLNAINLKDERENSKELNLKKDQKINLKSLRKEFSEIKSKMKKTKYYFNNNNINEQIKDNNNNNNSNINYRGLRKEKNNEMLENTKTSFNNTNNKPNSITGANILSMNLEMKKNSQEHENKNAQSKNYLEVPIDINLTNLHQNADKSLSLQQNKENFNTINLNENLEEQSICSFISKI